MITYSFKAGTADVSVVIRIIDSTDGTPETGVVYDTTGIDLEYRREGAVSVDITEATLAALTTAHTDGGFLHIGNGYYRLDLPDAACAAGAGGVLVHGTVTGMVVIGCYVQLVAYDPFDAVRQGMTALPNAAAEASGGLYTRGTGAGQINQPANGQIDANAVKVSGTAQTAGDLAALITTVDTVVDTIAGQTDDIGVAGAGLTAVPWNAAWDAEVQSEAQDAITASALATAADLATVDTVVDAIKAKTDNLPSDPADESLVIAATDAIYSRLGAPAGASVSADVAAVKADTAAVLLDTGTDGVVVPQAQADKVWGTAARVLTAGTNIALAKGTGLTGLNDLAAADVRTAVGLASANLDTQLTAIDDYIDTEVAAIKAKTDLIPAAPAAVGDIPTAAAVADAVHDEVVEGTTTLRQMLRGFASALLGKLSGAATTTVTIRDIGDTKNRVTATVDADGNRTALSTDLT